MRTINQVLDLAKKVQKVPSDYKLALCTGIGEKALANYRHGRSLPDEKTCQKLADAMGEDPALLTVQMQAQRAKTDEARALWVSIAKRLQTGFSSLAFLVMVAIFSIAASALPISAATVSASSENIPAVYYVKLAKQAKSLFSRFIVRICEFMSVLCQTGNSSHV
jgi:transcriptional regulator with XRE-family HTH domain